MADMFADRQLLYWIRRMCDDPEKWKWEDTATWKSLTRLMFKHYTVPEIYNMMEECMVEAADEQWFEKKWMKDKTFPKRDIDYKPKRKSVIKIDLKKSKLKKIINDNLKISNIIKSYGIKTIGKKCICPFHPDKEPSLSFSDKENIFNCFGCSAKGDIIEFIRRMEKEDGNKKTS